MTRIPFSFRFLVRFAALSFLCLAAHELIHHLMVRLTCGAWGTMTFSTFALPAGCTPEGPVLLATLAGPLLTWLLIWGGYAMIRHGEVRPGVMLVLANLPLARVVTVLMRGGDEMVLGRALAPGEMLWLPILALTLLLFWMPVRTTARAIASPHRWAILAGFLVLPLPWDMLLKRVWLARLLEQHPAAVGGVPVLFMVACTMAIALLVLLRRPAANPLAYATAS